MIFHDLVHRRGVLKDFGNIVLSISGEIYGEEGRVNVHKAQGAAYTVQAFEFLTTWLEIISPHIKNKSYMK